MKTIQLFLIAIFFISFTNTKAQEKQNDATWEETISFLKEHVSRFDSYVTYHKNNSSNSYSRYYHSLFTHTINSKGIITQAQEFDNKTFYCKADLKYLKSIKTKQIIGEKPTLKLWFEYDVVDCEKYVDKDSYLDLPYFTDVYFVNSKFQKIKPLKNDRLRDKVYKAFQHLAYLAKEKRKKSKF